MTMTSNDVEQFYAQQFSQDPDDESNHDFDDDIEYHNLINSMEA